MNGITTVSNPFSSLNPSKFIKHKIDNLINERDTNGDNTLSIKELGVPKDIFDRIDKNGDGQAGRFELNIAARSRVHTVNERTNHLISKKDTNGDGVLNVGELGVPETVFDRIDKNGNGQVGRVELNIAARSRIHAVNERTNHLISKKDTNGDGVLNVGELGVPETVFDRIDKNGNGQVGRVELNIAARSRIHAAINNRTKDILPTEASSKLDTIV
ncbi:MAG: EF-hand domain-containing protein [Candidatus Scalindua sp.]